MPPRGLVDTGYEEATATQEQEVNTLYILRELWPLVNFQFQMGVVQFRGESTQTSVNARSREAAASFGVPSRGGRNLSLG